MGSACGGDLLSPEWAFASYSEVTWRPNVSSGLAESDDLDRSSDSCDVSPLHSPDWDVRPRGVGNPPVRWPRSSARSGGPNGSDGFEEM